MTRSVIIAIAIFLVGISSVAFWKAAHADDKVGAPKTLCGKTTEECQKIVDGLNHQIAILQVKLNDYVVRWARDEDQIEQYAAENKAAQIGSKP